MKRYWHVLTPVLLLSMFLAACSPAATPAPTPTGASSLKIAMLTTGPITDEGWNQLAYEGLQALKAKGFTVANTENVAQADQASDIESYINQGFNVIIGHGFEYGDALKAAAAKHPTDYFIQIGGNATAANLKSYEWTPGEGGYVSGVLAAKMSKSGKFGFVGAVKIPTIAIEETAYEQAIKAAKPDATIAAAYSGSFSDIAGAKEAALAQISAGVDFILANGDNANVGAIQAIQQNGPNVLAIGWTLDQAHLAPANVATSVLQRVDVILSQAVTDIQSGTFKGDNVHVGLTEGMTSLAPFGPMVPADVQAAVKQAINDVQSGKVRLPPCSQC